MKILHTADWHLGKYLLGFSRLEEQKEVLDEIINITEANDIDIVLLAGDIFDTFNPPAEATEIFYKKIKKITGGGRCIVIAIAGNHDSADRIEAPDPLAIENGIIFCGYPGTIPGKPETEYGITTLKTAPGFIELKFEKYDYPVRIITTPYANEQRLKTFLGTDNKEEALENALAGYWKNIADEHCDNTGVNLLVTHLFMAKRGGPVPDEPEEEKPILRMGGAQVIFSDVIPDTIQYTALGHLHGRIKLGTPEKAIYYSGSPVAYGFGENQDKFVIVADIEPGKINSVTEIPLTKGKRLVRKEFDNVDDAVLWLNDNTDKFAELVIKSDDYLKPEDSRRLKSINRYIDIIPKITGDITQNNNSGDVIDINKPVRELFRDYFKDSTGQEPNDDIQKLFDEILASDEE